MTTAAALRSGTNAPVELQFMLFQEPKRVVYALIVPRNRAGHTLVHARGLRRPLSLLAPSAVISHRESRPW